MSNPQTLSPAQHRHSSKSPRQKKAPASPGLSSSRHETTAQCAALCLCRRCTPEQPPACPCRPVIGPKFVFLWRGCPGSPLSRAPFLAFILTCDRSRSNLARHERATSSDTPNHCVSVDRRGFRGVRLPLFLCGGSERLDHCGGRFNGLCWTILALGRVHQPGPETGELKLCPKARSREMP